MDVNITLDPAKLSNPDADLRYLIPDKVSTISDGKISDNGYDYDEEDRMIICLTSTDLSEALIRQYMQNVFTELGLEAKALTVKVDV